MRAMCQKTSVACSKHSTTIIEVVAYDDIQFTKAPHVLRGMGAGDLEKTSAAIAELAEKGMAPDDAG